MFQCVEALRGVLSVTAAALVGAELLRERADPSMDKMVWQQSPLQQPWSDPDTLLTS